MQIPRDSQSMVGAHGDTPRQTQGVARQNIAGEASMEIPWDRHRGSRDIAVEGIWVGAHGDTLRRTQGVARRDIAGAQEKEMKEKAEEEEEKEWMHTMLRSNNFTHEVGNDTIIKWYHFITR